MNNNIVVCVQGGLGNQLFQYGFARYLEIIYKKKVKLDTASFNNNFRRFKLNLFKTKLRVANEKEVENSKYQRKKFLFWKKKKTEYPEDNNFNFKYSLNRITNGYLIGYWPKTNYLNEIKEQLRKEIQIDNKLLCTQFMKFHKMIKNEESVGIHVRRGDYLLDKNKKIFAQINNDYYVDSVKQIKNKYNNCKFFVFSDDIDSVKNLRWAKSKDFIFVSLTSEHQDVKEFELLKACKHHIIANSTFSWWAAFLNDNETGQKISPQKWYSNEVFQKLYEDKYILDSSFIRI